MGKVNLELSVSFDGFVAGANVEADNPMGDGGELLHDWMFDKATDTGRSIKSEMFDGAGAIVIGRRMFDLGKRYWDPDPETFHQLPVFVLTHRSQEPIVDEGGSTFTFVSSVDDALAQARAAAGERDVLLGGGGDLARQFVRAGLVDELRIHLVHLLLGGGTQLFEPNGADIRELKLTRLVEDDGVTHLRFAV